MLEMTIKYLYQQFPVQGSQMYTRIGIFWYANKPDPKTADENENYRQSSRN
jgi:hypothetical protein